ncbi:MAG: clan AA aspartic protease [Rhodothermales bacterium]
MGAVVDTGYDGSLTLPAKLIAALALEWQRRGRALLADGSESIFEIYDAEVEWDGEWKPVTVDAAETTPLIGMRLLRGYELRVEVVEGGVVTVAKQDRDV